MAMSRSFGGTAFTTRSPMEIVPRLMPSRPAIIRSAVVLPQPEGPTKTTNSPSWMSRLRSDTAMVPSGYSFDTSSSTISAIGPPLELRGSPAKKDRRISPSGAAR